MSATSTGTGTSVIWCSSERLTATPDSSPWSSETFQTVPSKQSLQYTQRSFPQSTLVIVAQVLLPSNNVICIGRTSGRRRGRCTFGAASPSTRSGSWKWGNRTSDSVKRSLFLALAPRISSDRLVSLNLPVDLARGMRVIGSPEPLALDRSVMPSASSLPRARDLAPSFWPLSSTAREVRAQGPLLPHVVFSMAAVLVAG